MDNWDSLNCPLPDCGHELFLRYDKTFGLSGFDFNTCTAPDHHEFDVSDWKVECLSGHVILTPGPIDLDDENPETVESEEMRIFTDKDMARLIAVLSLDWEKIYV